MALAFAILSVDYVLLGLIPLRTGTQVYVFGVRLVAFGSTLYGLYEKNRS